jgi:hypothetical protein
MTKDEIIELAKQVKMPYFFIDGAIVNIEKLIAFADLVAKKEREKCALMVMPLDESLADEIRKRGYKNEN